VAVKQKRESTEPTQPCLRISRHLWSSSRARTSASLAASTGSRSSAERSASCSQSDAAGSARTWAMSKDAREGFVFNSGHLQSQSELPNLLWFSWAEARASGGIRHSSLRP
jgi:hypothetical protein